MLATRRNKLTGLLYLAPALLFVAVFTFYPFMQMVWMSFNSWSLITPPEVHRHRQLHARVHRQPVLGVADLQPQVHAAHHADPDRSAATCIALLVADNSPIRRVTRTVVFIPVVIGLGVSSLLWYWLFNPTVRPDRPGPARPRPDREADPLARHRRRHVDLGDHRLDHLEGHRVRDAAVRRGDPGDPARDQRGGGRRRRELLAAGAGA